MKRLTSLCRKSRFAERWLRRENLPYTLSISTMLVAASCRLSHSEPQIAPEPIGITASASGALTTPPAATAETPAEADPNSISLVEAGGKRTVASLTAVACDPTASTTASARVTLVSPFGSHLIALAFEPVSGQDGERITASVEGYKMAFASTGALGAELRAKACADGESDVPELLEVDATMTLKFAEALEHVAPDCERIELAAAGFVCRLPRVDPDQAQVELVGIQTTMIRRWSRQPYLLARRLAIGVTLAQALQSQDVDKSLTSFCRLMQSALPTELPATLASQRWQQVACDGTPENAARRAEAARFGLAKTIGEIDTMRQLFESTSRLGHLAVRISGKVLPGNRVLVNLTPDADVAENLARETRRLASDGAGPAAGEAPRACWHPAYAEHAELLRLARYLSLAGDTDLASCDAPPVTAPSDEAPRDESRWRPDAFAVERYFSESITSETEFVVSNGKAKTLRLPAGHYTYTLRTLPEDAGSWDDASQVAAEAKGSIVWESKRPHAVISAW